MNSISLSVLMVLGLLGQLGYSQEPVPTPPWVAPVQAGTQWEISVHYADSDSAKTDGGSSTVKMPAKDRRPVAISCRRGTDLTQVVVKWSDGTNTEGYVVGDSVLRRKSESKRLFVVPAQDEDYACPLYVSGFIGTAWLSMEFYKGVERVEKEKCFKFVHPPYIPPNPETEAGYPELTAWVRVSDKAPVRVKIGDAIYDFSSVQPVTEPVAMPSDMRQAFERLLKEQRSLELLKAK